MDLKFTDRKRPVKRPAKPQQLYIARIAKSFSKRTFRFHLDNCTLAKAADLIISRTGKHRSEII